MGGSSASGVVISGGGDLGGGSPLPDARLKCWDEEAGIGFMCEQYEKECCEKKDVCYDPQTEPTFCDRPYCD